MAAPAGKSGGKAMAAAASSKDAATVDDMAKKAAQKKLAQKKADGVVKKADDMAKKEVQKKAVDRAKKAAQKKAAAAANRVRKATAATASFKAAATVDEVAKKAAEAAAKRVGKAVSAKTCTGVHCSHPLSRDIQEKEENTERPGLDQCNCKYHPCSGDGIFGKACKYNLARGKIPVAPITDYNFLGLPIRPGQKDCPYYMSSGSCKYESNCWFNHPDPTTMEGGDAPSVCGNGESGSSQGAFPPTVCSWSPPKTANESVPFVPVVFSPTHEVPPPNVEWNGYQNTTIRESPQPHSSLTPVAVAPSPLASPSTTASSPPALPSTADGTLPTSPKLVEDDPELVKTARFCELSSKMVKLCAQSCELKAAYEFVDTTVDYMCAEVEKMFLKVGDSTDEGIERLDMVDPKCLKKRVNLRKCRRRLRKRKKVLSKPTRLGQATGAE